MLIDISTMNAYCVKNCSYLHHKMGLNYRFNGFFNGKTSRIIIMENAFSCLYKCFVLMFIGFRTIMRNPSQLVIDILVEGFCPPDNILDKAIHPLMWSLYRHRQDRQVSNCYSRAIRPTFFQTEGERHCSEW